MSLLTSTIWHPRALFGAYGIGVDGEASSLHRRLTRPPRLPAASPLQTAGHTAPPTAVGAALKAVFLSIKDLLPCCCVFNTPIFKVSYLAPYIGKAVFAVYRGTLEFSGRWGFYELNELLEFMAPRWS